MIQTLREKKEEEELSIESQFNFGSDEPCDNIEINDNFGKISSIDTGDMDDSYEMF